MHSAVRIDDAESRIVMHSGGAYVVPSTGKGRGPNSLLDQRTLQLTFPGEPERLIQKLVCTYDAVEL
jgi:hypothetical protein